MIADRTFSAIAIRAIDYDVLSTSYASLGSALTEPVYILIIKNTTDVIVKISEDASTDHYELAPGESEVYDFQANKSVGIGAKRTGLQFSVKMNSGASPTAGRVIIQGQTI